MSFDLLLTRNHGLKLQILKNFRTLNLNISFGHQLHIRYYEFFESLLGLPSFHGKKIVCKQWPGAKQWSKNRFCSKHAFTNNP